MACTPAVDKCGSTTTPSTVAPPPPVNPEPTPAPAQRLSPPRGPQPDFDAMPSIRAAFYYPWFPETWPAPDGGTFTNFHPDAGSYSSTDPAVLARHVDELAYAHVDVAISSWWGDGSVTARRFDALLAATTTTALHWSIYYEPESKGDPSSAAIVADLGPMVAAHRDDPRLFRLDGRFVVFVYGGAGETCSQADRWKAAAQQLGIYVVLKVFHGFRDCASQPDAWHQYAPAVAASEQLPWSSAVSAGFWLWGEAPRLARDPAAYRQAVTAMVAAAPKFQLITTFNEWGEGTAVEPAQEWASASGFGTYLDILHEIPPR